MAALFSASERMSAVGGEMSRPIDLVREIRLRQWARLNYVDCESRIESWHPIVLDEMRRRDVEIELSEHQKRDRPLPV